MNNYYLSVFPGLAGVAADELKARWGVKTGTPKRLRNTELVPVLAKDPRQLLELRTVEDVFVDLGIIKLSGRADDLRVMAKSAAFLSALSAALGVYIKATGKTVPARSQFRVVVQADDAAWRKYRRIDIQIAAESAVLRARPQWRLAREEAPLEIWLQQTARELVVGLRLTTGEHRSRGGRAAEREAALRPTIAAAMVQLAGVSDGDVVLDPMCGSGTILLERAEAGRHGMLLGGDSDVRAVEAALANFGPRHQPREIVRWDARKLPLEAASIDKVLCNLPWGRQIGRPEDLPALYREVLMEMVRVVKPGARLVLLTSEWDLFKRTIRTVAGLKLERTVADVEILGRRADILVLTRV